MKKPENRVNDIAPGYLRPEAACRYISMSRRQLQRLMSKRAIAFIKVNRKMVMFRVADLDAFMSKFYNRAAS